MPAEVRRDDGDLDRDLPSLDASVAYIRRLGKPTVAEVLRAARAAGSVAVQPRCGVGGHREMLDLLRTLESEASPEILSVTIDSHTRLLDFSTASRVLRSAPEELNGYPLVTHGWRRGRELNEAVGAPLEIRHGSPEGWTLFASSVASGITSFEGGAIAYNLPYSKDVPLAASLRSWHRVDRACGELARRGVIVDRELFGSLTGVLVPPSISLAISVIEAVSAARDGVRCISIAYPQNGHLVQDVAALRAIPRLARAYLPPEVEVHPVLHQFMGVFPRERSRADALIFYGGLTARLGAATKVVTKTNEEAFGIPTARANAEGMRTTRVALDPIFDFVRVDDARVEEELSWIEREVHEIVDPVLDGPDLDAAIVEAFAAGRLDVPFSASVHARSAVVPMRDPSGAVRYLRTGDLPLVPATRARNDALVASRTGASGQDVVRGLLADIGFFSASGGDTVPALPSPSSA